MKLHLRQIKCNVNDESDGDEIYLKFKGKKVWPSGLFKGIKINELVQVDVTLDVPDDEFVTIELWEYDLLSKNDYLGTFEMKMNETGGPFTTSLKLKKPEYMASYLLIWEAAR